VTAIEQEQPYDLDDEQAETNRTQGNFIVVLSLFGQMLPYGNIISSILEITD